MSKFFMTKKRANALSQSLFFIGLALLVLLNSWWPGIMLVIGIPLALKQFLSKRPRDGALTLFVFGGFFVFGQFDISWKVLIPILLIMAAVYILCKEWVRSEAEEK